MATVQAIGEFTLTLDQDSLPEWDLSDLYPGFDSEELARDLDAAQSSAAAFGRRYGGKLADLDGAGFGAAIADYEIIDEILGRVMSYASLAQAVAMDDPEVGRFHQTMHERVNAISATVLFFTLELNDLDDAILSAKMKHPAAAHYAAWVRDRRALRPHQLSRELERLLHEKSVAGRAAWMRLFEQNMDDLRFSIDGRDLTSAEALHLLSDHDGAVRKSAAKAIGEVLGENLRGFALIYNTLIKDKEIDDQWRGYRRPISARNLSNYVEDEVVEALTAAVKDAYPKLSHRYYAIKARWFGVDALPYWDRNAPLPEEDDRLISWDQAKISVLGAYGAFSPEMANLGRRFFDNAWIDARTRSGKAPGAFSHPTVPGAHPYILLNYQGSPRDVMTLAHELGHGVHQLLAAGRGALMADTPLTLAETASVFGEQLTFRALLDGEADTGRRRAMLAAKVEDMLNTVVRQIAFCDFERRLHDERRGGELTPARISEIWLDVQTESLGPSIILDEGYGAYWSYIPHFIHTPFYVYAYAFGDCLVNSLYGVYEDSPDGFEAKYLAMLRAGGSLRHGELLAPFGLDASDPGFWKRGLDVISGFIDELEG